MVTEPAIMRRRAAAYLRAAFDRAGTPVHAPGTPVRVAAPDTRQRFGAPDAGQRIGAPHTRHGIGAPGTPRRAAVRRAVSRLPFRITDLLLPEAVALWAIGVGQVDVRALGLAGLPAILPIVFYVGLAVLIVSAGIELARRRPSAWRMSLHAGALVLMLYGTAPLVYSQGRYPWLYKTIGVVQYVNAHGSLNSTIDIYQNWSGFFAFAAWFGKVAGVSSPLSYAKWSQLVVELAALPLLYLIYDSLSLTVRQRWVALLLYPASNWIAQDYFSPQALGTLFGLGVMAVAVRWLSVAPYLDRHLRRRAPAIDSAEETVRPRLSSFLRRPRFTHVTLCVLFFILTFTHELSPYIVAIQLGALAVIGLLRPRWLPIILAAVAIGYLLPHFTFVNQKYGLLDSFGNFFSNVGPPSAAAGQISSTTQLVARFPEALSIGMWLLAAVGAWLRRGEGRRVLGLVLLAYSPAAVLVLQAYGQEGILRVYLFSLPWCAALAALALVPAANDGTTATTPPPRGRVAKLTGRLATGLAPALATVRAAAGRVTRGLRLPAGQRMPGTLRAPLALAVAVALFLPGFFGNDAFYRMPGSEVATITSFLRNATPGPIYPAIDSGPFNDTARYNLFPKEGIFGGDSMLGGRRATPDIANVIADVAVRQTGGKEPAYVIVAPSMVAYNQAYAATTPASFAILLASLAHSHLWTRVVDRSGTVIYELPAEMQPYVPQVQIPPSASSVSPAVP